MLGGAQRTTLLLVAGLRRRGWAVTVATPGPGPFVDELRRAGSDHLEFPLPAALMQYGHETVGWKAARALALLPAVWWRTARQLKGRFDVVHTIDARGQILLAPAARRAGVPVVWQAHAVELSRMVNRFCSGFADRTVVPDRSMAERVGARTAESVCEVPNALPPEVLAWVERPAPPPSARLVSIGRLDPCKGYEVLLDAVAELRARGMPVTARIVGPAPPAWTDYRRSIEAQRAALKVEDAVELAGAVDDVYPELAGAGVFVQPSHQENQPLAVMEAMAAGVPVVATRVGAVAALLDGGGRGWLVEPGSPAALADAVSEVLARSDEARRRADAARHWIGAAADPETMVSRMEAVYRSL